MPLLTRKFKLSIDDANNPKDMLINLSTLCFNSSLLLMYSIKGLYLPFL